jgi:hypothetical protein
VTGSYDTDAPGLYDEPRVEPFPTVPRDKLQGVALMATSGSSGGYLTLDPRVCSIGLPSGQLHFDFQL